MDPSEVLAKVVSPRPRFRVPMICTTALMANVDARVVVVYLMHCFLVSEQIIPSAEAVSPGAARQFTTMRLVMALFMLASRVISKETEISRAEVTLT